MAGAFRLDTHGNPLVSEFIEQTLANVATRRIKFKNRDVIELSGLHDKKNQTAVIVDPARNYAVLSTVSHMGGGSRIEREILDLNEVKPGIYFPREVELRVVLQNSLYYSAQITFTTVSVNDELDPAHLELKFPEGLNGCGLCAALESAGFRGRAGWQLA